MQTIDKSIVSKIYGSGRGAVFTPTRFLDLGGRRAVDVVLHRLAKAGTIRRLTRGLYDYPKQHPTYGVMFPSPQVVAKVLAGKDSTRFQPSGAYAANLLGLSDQVLAKIVFLTDGRAKRVKIGRSEIILKRTSPPSGFLTGRVEKTLESANSRKGFLGLLDAQTVVRVANHRGTSHFQGRHVAVESLQSHRAVLRRH